MLTLASSASQEFFIRTIAAIAHLHSQHMTLSLGIVSTLFRLPRGYASSSVLSVPG